MLIRFRCSNFRSIRDRIDPQECMRTSVALIIRPHKNLLADDRVKWPSERSEWLLEAAAVPYAYGRSKAMLSVCQTASALLSFSVVDWSQDLSGMSELGPLPYPPPRAVEGAGNNLQILLALSPAQTTTTPKPVQPPLRPV